MHHKGTIILSFLLLFSLLLSAQTEVDERAVIHFDKGLGFFAPDSAFGVNLRFRMQNRIGITTISGQNLTPEEFEANVRRLRLRFDGYIGKTGLTYYLQLSFSRGDQDWDASGFPGIVRDAMVFYNFTKHFYIGMGQGKLPGNRQRVISSGQQQFADRSLANAIFNIDRDFGLMAYYTGNMGKVNYKLKGAVSTGEGRNMQKTDNGLAYTIRYELLPFGPFLKDGDFSEGDLEREPAPKLSLGASYSMNKNARRASGQRGQTLIHPTDISNYFFDMIAKYQGWALQAEYAKRMADEQPDLSYYLQNPGLFDGVYIFSGQGFNTQLSYVFRNKVELAGRYTFVSPHREIDTFEPESSIIMLGFTKYLPNHRNKLQVNISHKRDTFAAQASNSKWHFMLQAEIGI